jgi:hypothetical protein
MLAEMYIYAARLHTVVCAVRPCIITDSIAIAIIEQLQVYTRIKIGNNAKNTYHTFEMLL